MRNWMNWPLAATALIICTGAAFAEFDPCGDCSNISRLSCEAWELEYPCHRWDQDTNDHDRGTDPHMYGGDFELGLDECIAEHGACSGGGEEDLLAAVDLGTAIQQGDGSIVVDLADLGFWLEVNEDRSAIQILGYCPETASENVVSHIPVSQEMLEFWGNVTS